MFATVRPDGRPHAVPITPVVVDDVILFAIDHKPKTSRSLQRLANIEREPRVSVLFDHRSDRWDDLWWVRADGVAVVHTARPSEADQLEQRHPPYRNRPPAGPWVRILVSSWSGWTASG